MKNEDATTMGFDRIADFRGRYKDKSYNASLTP